jgi:hypothetical protein
MIMRSDKARPTGQGKITLRRLLWIPSIALSLFASCKKTFQSTDTTQFTDARYARTIEIQQQTEMGMASIYVATPLKGNGEVLYYFHGGRDKDIDASVMEEVRNFIPPEIQAPAIVAVTFGQDWYLTPPTEKRSFSALRIFWDEILPRAEEITGKAVIRIGIGWSMGGFNLASLYADRPDKWDILVFLSPSVSVLSPVSSTDEISDYIRRTKTYSPMHLALSLFGVPLKGSISAILDEQRSITESKEIWASISPLERVHHIDAARKRSIPVLIRCGRSDSFGFFEGSSILASELGAFDKVTEQYFKGGHTMDSPSAVENFLRLYLPGDYREKTQ